MKLSTRARYGILVMVDIAVNGADHLVLAREIAGRQAISQKYLEQILAQLRNSDLLEAERGSKGGYRLSRPASEIRLDEAFEALEGRLSPVDCLVDPLVCDRSTECVARELWDEMTNAMRGVLRAKTLEDLKKRWEEIHRRA